MCLVSSSSSEVGQFNFESCLLVQEIISVIHYLPCFGGGLLLCLFTDSSVLSVYFFALPFISGAGMSPAPFAVHARLQIAVYFSVLWSLVLDAALVLRKSALVIHYLPCFGEFIAHLLSVFTAFLCLFTDSSLPFSLSLVPVQHFTSLLCCLCFITVHYLFFSFVGLGTSQPRGCTSLCSWGWIGDSYMVCGANLFVLSIDMQAGLEAAEGVAAAVRNGTKFSQCKVAWGGVPGVRGS
jgi:hypothetical protein